MDDDRAQNNPGDRLLDRRLGAMTTRSKASENPGRAEMIGMHAIIYSTAAEKDRKFLSDVLGLASVDAGEGWLIFALPPSEIAVHPDKKGGVRRALLHVQGHQVHAGRAPA
jgi:hypothetical protein